MKAFVTGVGGQLGHDVVNELKRKRWDVVGSDIHVTYSGIQDGSDVVRAPYVQLDITDREAVLATIEHAMPFSHLFDLCSLKRGAG